MAAVWSSLATYGQCVGSFFNARTLLVLLVLSNIKSLPFMWTVRVPPHLSTPKSSKLTISIDRSASCAPSPVA